MVLRRHGITLLGLAMIAAGGIWAAVAWASTSVIVDGADGPTSVDINDVPVDVKNEGSVAQE